MNKMDNINDNIRKESSRKGLAGLLQITLGTIVAGTAILIATDPQATTAVQEILPQYGLFIAGAVSAYNIFRGSIKTYQLCN